MAGIIDTIGREIHRNRRSRRRPSRLMAQPATGLAEEDQ
jgi:hypothetical protein